MEKSHGNWTSSQRNDKSPAKINSLVITTMLSGSYIFAQENVFLLFCFTDLSAWMVPITVLLRQGSPLSTVVFTNTFLATLQQFLDSGQGTSGAFRVSDVYSITMAVASYKVLNLWDQGDNTVGHLLTKHNRSTWLKGLMYLTGTLNILF